MGTKEEFYEQIKEIRAVLADPKKTICSCPKVACEWHGDCTKCVAIHRHYKDHVPNCFQQFINEKLNAVAGIGEMEAVEKEKTPREYWEYVKERDADSDV